MLCRLAIARLVALRIVVSGYAQSPASASRVAPTVTEGGIAVYFSPQGGTTQACARIEKATVRRQRPMRFVVEFVAYA